MATAPAGTIWGAYDYPTSGNTANGIRVGVYITWSGNASGSVQSDSISAVATIKIYTQNIFSYSDLQTLTYTGGAISGSTLNFNNNSAGAGDQVERATKSYTYNYTTYGSSPGNITITATLSGAITGVTPFVTTVQAIPARPGGVPSAPTSVTSTPGNATVSIGFGAPSTNDPATTSYEWSNDNVNWGAITTNPFSEAGTNGTAKTVYVRAVNGAGAGPSASATSTPRTVPDALSFSAAPINGNLTIAYSAPSFDGGTAVTSYQYSTNAGSTWTTTPSNPFNVSGTNGTAITVYMRAVNAAGNGAATSVTETPRTTPSAPASVTSTPNDGFVSIAFTAPSGTSPTNDGGESIDYYQYSTDNSNWSTIYANPFAFNGANGTAITVYVRAVNAAGGGAQNNATSTPRTVPSAPTSVASTPANGSISVSFGAPSSNGGSAVTGYEYSTNAGSTWTAVPSNTSPFTVSGTNGTAITVYVRAVNAAGGGSGGATTNTPRTVPSAPQSFAGSNTTFGQITLSWAAPSSNGGNAVSSYVLRTGATVLQNTSATSYVHTGLSAYTDYSYTVTAANAAGESTAASITVKSMGGVVNVWSGSAWVKVVPQVRNTANTAWVTGQARARNNSTSEWKYGT